MKPALRLAIEMVTGEPEGACRGIPAGGFSWESRRMPRQIRRVRGITLIELIVGILLVGVALTLVLPLIVSARTQARTHAGVNNMRKLGQAMHSYHDVYRSFPSPPKRQ